MRTWMCWNKSYKVFNGFNIELEADLNLCKYGFVPLLVIWDGEYKKGSKLITGIYLGPLSLGIEFRFRMGQK